MNLSLSRSGRRGLALPFLLLGALWLALAASSAQAGANEMRRNLEPHLKQFNPPICQGAVHNTLVRGLYRCDGPAGYGHAYVNEAASLVMPTNSRDITDFIETGAGAKPVPEPERRALIADMIRNIRYEELIHIKQGNGGGKVLLLSAFDCPYCIKLERTMATPAHRIEADVYILPSTLDASKNANVSTVRNVWCARDNAAVWRQTLTKATGGYFDLPHGSCDLSNQDTKDIETLLAVLGPDFKRRAYPRMILGNGQIYTAAVEAGELKEQLAAGASGSFWQATPSDSYLNFRPGNRTAAATTANGEQAGNGNGKKRVTVGLGDLFKRLGGSDDSKKTEKQEGSSSNGNGN